MCLPKPLKFVCNVERPKKTSLLLLLLALCRWSVESEAKTIIIGIAAKEDETQPKQPESKKKAVWYGVAEATQTKSCKNFSELTIHRG